eukprot:TRINITY_DN52948_c0_g1_i1.p1 TRINITY_DN52948_c0_g1~~TRINITY_DN52948_c0_g1_i1.p1  ORF type:complete len:109 (+),score=3.36 TRINITY_DN52948_c0_g1_i1:2-328(+)
MIEPNVISIKAYDIGTKILHDLKIVSTKRSPQWLCKICHEIISRYVTCLIFQRHRSIANSLKDLEGVGVAKLSCQANPSIKMRYMANLLVDVIRPRANLLSTDSKCIA